MQKLIICTIFDKATEAYMRPFFAQSPGQALRMFKDDVNSPDSVVNKHPEDYALFEIGIYDDSNASIKPCEPVCLARAHEIKDNPVNTPAPVQLQEAQ